MVLLIFTNRLWGIWRQQLWPSLTVKNIHIPGVTAATVQCVLRRPACHLGVPDQTETYITPLNDTQIAYSGNHAAVIGISVQQHRHHERGGPHCSPQTVSVFHPGSQSTAGRNGGKSEKVTLALRWSFPGIVAYDPPNSLWFWSRRCITTLMCP